MQHRTLALLAALLALAVGPFPDHLLLGAHMRNQPLDGFGEICHCRGGVAAAAFLYRRAQPLQGAGEIAAEHNFDPALVRQVARMVDRNEYKRQQAAPGLKISPKAFGYGRRYPIAAKLDS